jgi:anti-anti-sigma factor
LTVTVTHPATGLTLVGLAGELHALTRPTLDQHLERQLRDPHHHALILDMSHLSYCNVAGLTCLLRARDLAHDQHVSFQLVTGALVERLLRLLDLHDRFVTCPDLTTAHIAATTTARARAGSAGPPTSASADSGKAAIHAMRVS